jgi:NADPH-dependent glutamate synthase beta subunit-like oxidoreductase
VVSSRSFVNWYNGHPDFADLDKTAFDLSKVEHVVVVGQGNVALDCARILTKHTDDLRETDISTEAFRALCNSNVKSVTVLGRRGHIQSAFTIKEFRELTRLRGVAVSIDPTELERGRTEASIQELDNNRPKKRIVDLIESVCMAGKAAAESEVESTVPSEPVSKTINVRYLATPMEVISDPATQRVTGLKVVRNNLVGVAGKQKAVPVTPSGEASEESHQRVLPCDLLIRAVGYRCEPISSKIPFSTATNTIPHAKGRIVDAAGTSSAPLPGMYVTGWLKRGATGIIASNIPDAKDTAAAIGEDLRAGLLTQLEDSLIVGSELVSSDNFWL